MKFKFALVLAASLSLWAAQAAPPTYTAVPSNGSVIITFTNTYLNGVSTLEGRLNKKWVPLQNFWTTGRIGRVTLPLPPGYSDYRLKSSSVAPGNAFVRLALVYNQIYTVGGTGPAPEGTNLWKPEFEGTNATAVTLSNPRYAVAGDSGEIYVVEKDSHSVSVIDTNGILRTAIGTRQPGYFAILPPAQPPATFTPLRSPSGIHYTSGKLYVLDAGNGRVLRYTNGLVSQLFTESPVFGQSTNIANGGGLWVSPDEEEAYYTDGHLLKRWQASQLENGSGGVTIVASGFVNLSDVKVNPAGQTIVADRGDNVLWRVSNDGFKTPEAGTGSPTGRSVGPVERASIPGPSSLAFMPIGGYLLGLDQGTRVWYVDVEDEGAPLVFGKSGTHAGDGEWFQKGRKKPKISHVRSVNLAPSGDIVILEDGYVRTIRFLRRKP